MSQVIKESMTLAEMIDRDILETKSNDMRQLYKGFTIGARGKIMFWYFSPTRNGYYVIWPTDEYGNIYRPRYVDADKTIVTVHPI